MARQIKNTEYAAGMSYIPKYAVSGKILVTNNNYTSFRNFAEMGQKATKISFIGKIAVAGVLTFLIYQLTKN